MTIDAIRTEDDHDAALRQIELLWGAAKGTEAGDRLDRWLTLVEAFERQRYPIAASIRKDGMTRDMD